MFTSGFACFRNADDFPEPDAFKPERFLNNGVLEGDSFFPEIDKAEWKEVFREDHQPDEKNHVAYSFITLER